MIHKQLSRAEQNRTEQILYFRHSLHKCNNMRAYRGKLKSQNIITKPEEWRVLSLPDNRVTEFPATPPQPNPTKPEIHPNSPRTGDEPRGQNPPNPTAHAAIQADPSPRARSAPRRRRQARARTGAGDKSPKISDPASRKAQYTYNHVA